jgi:hypothetical protein
MNEDQLLFEVSKLIAESDSIGEGYWYCAKYDKKKHNDPAYQEYRDLAQVIIDLVKEEVKTDEV